MKAVHTFTVTSQLPAALAPLREVVGNLGWIHDERAQELFRRIDPQNWDYERDPAGMLATESTEHLTELGQDPSFIALAEGVRDELRRSLVAPRWFQHRPEGPLRSVGYFAAEFGVAAALPQYSGGLGVLAGDHLKAADELGLPLTGIGLFYHHGYFRQHLDIHGRQQESFPRLDPEAMAMVPVADVRITVDLAGAPVIARIWEARVGRIPLLLLDTDVDENPDDLRLVTDRLYGGGVEERIRQEILLGIGGVRALEALDRLPQVFHINEGHAGFLALERIRRLMVQHGLTFSEAKTAVRPGGLFTTHTPVPAGIDRFPRDLMEKYFTTWCREVGLAFDELMELGHEPGEPEGEIFNMAVMSLRLAGQTNGVSKLHGRISREMFSAVWPGLPVDEVPISSVTNGVHGRTWVTREMSDLFERRIGSDWQEAPPERWIEIEATPDSELWTVRRLNRERLVRFVRHRVKTAGRAKGMSDSQVAWADEALDPGVLTIGFARRFATYKRANLLFGDTERLKALLSSTERPVQIVIAGKAHPADEAGKQLLAQVANAADDLDTRLRLVFVEDYDISVATVLVAGVDVWLNNPLRPMEACGTSGMKAALNGALNLSILDGWWDECYEPDIGWAIPSAEWHDDLEARNAIEAEGLFGLLERQVVPLFYRRDADGLPVGWLRMVKASLARLGPELQATRMLKQYVTDHYEPAAARSGELAADSYQRARDLVRWKRSVFRSWPLVAVAGTSLEPVDGDHGSRFRISAEVDLGDLSPDDVAVEALFGPVGADDELHHPTVATLDPSGAGSSAPWHRFSAEVSLDRAGNYGYTVRVVPTHPDLLTHAHLARIAWAPLPPTTSPPGSTSSPPTSSPPTSSLPTSSLPTATNQ